MSTLAVHMLGPVRILLGGKPMTNFRTRKVQALLCYLAAEPGQHLRDALLELLWPGMPARSARSNLRQILYYTRKAVPKLGDRRSGNGPVAFLVTDRKTVRTHPDARLSVDCHRFEQLLEDSRTHDHVDLLYCQECRQLLEAAVALYRGDFLADLYLEDSNPFEAWAQARRAHFRRQALDALAILAGIATRQKDYARAQAYASRQLELDNLREAAYRQLMEALALAGRREEALATYDECRQVLAAELGMSPSARTTEIYEQIRAGDLRFDTGLAQDVRGYELKEEIGRGRYGVIHRAVQPGVGREVAVKVIRRRYADDPAFIRRFEREARLVARLEHPHIVPLYDYWRDPAGAFLVMRYMRQGSLLTALKDGPWSAKQAARLLEQVAGALANAHRRGVIHRDVKPGNILLDEAGNAYLADFGIAQDLIAETTLATRGHALGSLDYTSPEQIRNEPVTPRTDIYSLGVVMYQLLTGEHPFTNGTMANLIHSQLNKPLPRVTEARPDVDPAVDAVLRKASAKDPGDRYASVLEMTAAFRRVVEGKAGEAPTVGLPARLDVPNPYKGLRAFEEADAADFFGREALTHGLIARLGEDHFLAVVGPSGSGKSSVVKAGLIPALRAGALPGSEAWFVATMVPGASPLEQLATALIPIAVDPPADLVGALHRDVEGLLRTIRRVLPAEEGARLLLVIDQFEELFTLVEDDATREFFLAGLLHALDAPNSPLRMVITLRADFYDRPLRHPALGRLLKEYTEVVLPLSREELARAIQEPARRVGAQLEEGLVNVIARDVADQPGALPLLQYTLAELFDRREGDRLTHAGFEALGGVRGALGRRAETLYDGLDAAGRRASRELFLRLITLGEGAEDTRRRVLRAELERVEVPGAAGGSPMETAIDRFGAARFLTFDRDPATRAPTVEVAHEALLREWPRLRDWLDASRDDVRQQRLLAAGAREWAAAARVPGYLLREARLDQFAGWAAASGVSLASDERAFLYASLAARAKRRAEEAARQERELEAARRLAETERARAEAEGQRAEAEGQRAEEESQRATEQAQAAGRLRRGAMLLAGTLVLALILGGMAVANAERADASAAFAQTREAAEARQRALAESARATAVAAEGIAEGERLQAEEQARLATSRELAVAANSLLDQDPELSMLLALEALETTYTKQAEEALHRALQSSRVLAVIPDHSTGLGTPAFAYAPDGSRLATTSNTGELTRIWDTTTFAELLTLEPVGTDFAGIRGTVLFDVAGDRVAQVLTAEDFQHIRVSIWDAGSGQPLSQHTLPGTGFIWAEVGLSPDFSLLAVGHEDGTVDLWDVASGENLLTFPGHDAWAWDVEFSPDGRLLLTNSNFRDVDVWDVAASVAAGEGRVVTSFLTSRDITGTRFSDGGSRVLVSLQGETGEIWDLADTRAPVLTLQGTLRASSPNDSLLAGGSYGDTHVPIYDGENGQLLFTLAGHSGSVGEAVFFSPDGRQLASGSADGTVRLWDVRREGGGERQTLTADVRMRDLELSPDGRLLALGNILGPAVVIDALNGEQRLTLPGEPGTGVYRVAFSPDSRRVAATGQDGHVRVWDVEEGALLLEFLAHLGGDSGGFFLGTLDVMFSPDGRRLATAGANTLAKVWDAETGAELVTYTGHTDGLHSLAYSPDGRMVATGSDVEDSSVGVWDPDNGEEIYSLEGHSGRIWGLAFSLDSRRLITTGSNGEVKVWDMTSGEELYMLPDQGGTVGFVAFGPDGRTFATGSENLGLFDLATGEEIVRLATGGPGIFSTDGRTVYAPFTAAGMLSIRLLTVNLEDTIALARERLTRGLTDQECVQYLHLADGCPAP